MAGYGTNDAFTAWLTANGFTLPGTASSLEVLRQRGSEYIDAVYGPRFVGFPTAGVEQDRAWPRINAVVYGSALATDVIPLKIVHAAYRAAYVEAIKPGILSVIEVPSRRVKSQEVKGIKREFFDPKITDSIAASVPIISDIEGSLSPYLMPADEGGMFIMTLGGVC